MAAKPNEWPGGYSGNAPYGSTYNQLTKMGGQQIDPDPADFSAKWVNYDDYDKGPGNQVGIYRDLLRSYLKDAGENEGESYRLQAYQGLGQQQAQSEAAARRATSRSFGGNNPTGMLGSLYAQSALATPYGAADMTARDVARRAAMESGMAMQQSLGAQAGWYGQLAQMVLNQRSLDQGQDQIDISEAMASSAASYA